MCLTDRIFLPHCSMNLDVTCILLLPNILHKKVSLIYFFQVLYAQSFQAVKQSYETKVVGYCTIFQTFSFLFLFLFFFFFFFCRTMLSVGQRDSSWCEQWAIKLQVKVRSAVTAHNNTCFGAYKFLFRGPSTRKPVSVFCDDGQGVCDEQNDLFYSTGPQGSWQQSQQQRREGQSVLKHTHTHTQTRLMDRDSRN